MKGSRHPCYDNPDLDVNTWDQGWVHGYYLDYLAMMENPDDAEMAVDLDRILIEEDVTAEDFKSYPPRLYEAEADLVYLDRGVTEFVRTRLYIGRPDKNQRICLAWDAVEGRWEKIFDSRQRNT